MGEARSFRDAAVLSVLVGLVTLLGGAGCMPPGFAARPLVQVPEAPAELAKCKVAACGCQKPHQRATSSGMQMAMPMLRLRATPAPFAAAFAAAALGLLALGCGGAAVPPPACSAAPAVATPSSAPAAAVAAPAKDAPPNAQALLSLIERRSQEFSDASATNDVAVLERDLDDRVVFINESGETATKKDLLSDPTPHPENAGTLVQTDFAVQLHGPVAVTSFTDNLTRPFHGQTFHASFRSTEVWLLEADGWRMISSQTLAVQADPPAITLPAKTLDEYVGTYKAGDDYIFKITRSGTELSGVRGAGEPFPIKAEVADVLFTPGDPRMRRIIVRDAKGKVTGLIARRDGHDITLTRVG